MEINQKEFKKWIRALRSGKYMQTKGFLENQNGHCCLGVACSILIHKNKQIIRDSYLYGNLPSSQQNAPEWLKEINNHFRLKTKIDLWELNDSNFVYIKEYDEDKNKYYTVGLEKFSFDEIADMLELVYIHKMLD